LNAHNEKLKTHIEKIKKTQGEFKFAPKGIKNLPRRNRMPIKEKPKSHTQKTKNT
jgi:hypothetical protein